MNKKVQVSKPNEVFKKAIFTIVEGQYKHEVAPNQWSEPIFRLNLIRGDAVAVLVHNRDTDEIIFTEQFRYPTFNYSIEHQNDKNNGWLVELPAGMIDKGETPEDAARREILEETGYQIHDLTHIHTFYLSPGTSGERIFLYYAEVRNKDKQNDGGGLAEEGEFITLINISLSKTIDALNSGGIRDSKTIIGLQWLQKNKL